MKQFRILIEYDPVVGDTIKSSLSVVVLEVTGYNAHEVVGWFDTTEEAIEWIQEHGELALYKTIKQ